MSAKPKVIVYVDGFNLYYGAVKNTSFKWLDIVKLFRRIMGGNPNVVLLRYFTAKVKSPPWDADKALRQQIYLDALRGTGLIEVHYGKFKIRGKKGKLSKEITSKCATCGSSVTIPEGTKTLIETPEEKGSDVNLASYLLLDAAKDRFDMAWVISNDSDLATPVLLARKEFGKKVGVVFYHRGLTAQKANPQRRSDELFHAAGKVHLYLQQNHLQHSLFPDQFKGVDGKIHRKPKSW